jgi:putative PEP-CTERM system TPR-repeat lipoprotein
MKTGRMLVLLLAFAALLGGCRRDPKTYAARGDAYAASGKYSEAAVEYRNALQRDARFGEVRFKLAEVYVKLGDAPNAYREFQRAADLLPGDARAQLEAGRVMWAVGEFEGARARAVKVLDKNPRNVEALVLLGNALAGLQDLDGAIKEIEQAIALDPKRGLTYVNLGVLQFGKGQRDQAETALVSAVTLDPKSVPARLAIANFYWATSRPQEAEAALKAALELEPRNVPALRALAGFLIGNGRVPEAEPYLKTAADAVPGASLKIVLADYYLGLQRIDEALRVLERAATLPDGLSPALTRIAGVRYEQGRKTEAYQLVADVLKNLPNDPQALMFRGRFQMGDGKRDEAVGSLKASVRADPRIPAAHYLLGMLSLPGDPKSAMESFAEVVKLAPRAVPALVQLAELYVADGNPQGALQFAADAARFEPGNAAVRELYVRVLLANGETNRAEEEIRELRSARPNGASGPLLAGVAALGRGDRAGAAKLFDEALKRDPASLEALTGLVQLRLADKRYADAKALVQARLARPPLDPRAYLLAAEVARATMDAAGIEAAYKGALQADPATLDAYLGLGRYYASQSRMPEAQREFEALAAKQPRSVGAHTMVAMTMQVQGKTEDARRKYEQVLQLDPRAPVAANNLACIYSESGGNLDIALQLAQTAKGGLPDRPEVNDTLGWIYYKKGLPAMAVRPLEEAVRKDQKNADYRYHLGMVYAKTGDSARARQELNAALALNPALPGAAEARKALASLL